MHANDYIYNHKEVELVGNGRVQLELTKNGIHKTRPDRYDSK